MAVEFKVNEQLLPEQMAEVFRLSGLKRPYNDLDRMEKMIDQADILISCWDGDRVVGVARAITDYCYCCYLSDLAVIKEYQKQNIGKDPVQLLQETLEIRCPSCCCLPRKLYRSILRSALNRLIMRFGSPGNIKLHS